MLTHQQRTILLVALLFVLPSAVFIYSSSAPTHFVVKDCDSRLRPARVSSSSFPHPQSYVDQQRTPFSLDRDCLSRLDTMVQKHAVNETIIIAFANANHLEYVFNWLAYIDLLQITNYLVGAMDSTTANALARVGAQHFTMFDDTPSAATGLLAGDLIFMSAGFLSIGLHKIALIKAVLSCHVDLIVSDVDTVWLENPQLYFANYLDADVLASTDSVAPTHDDGGLENPDVIGRYDLNVGLMLLRHRKNVTQLVDKWQQILLQPGMPLWDQAEFNGLIKAGMFENDVSWWDHTDRWERQYRPLLPAPSNRRLVRGFNDSVSVGFLPLTLFPNGHVYFTQKLHEKAEIKPYAVHATYAEGMLKRHRLREAQLWLSDDADYYTPGGLLMLDLGQLDVPADWEQLPSKDRVQFHMKNMAMQLDQFWYAAGVAVALSRVLILPRFMCYCDELWHLSLEVSPQWLCRYPGAVKQTLPFHCSADSVLNYPRLDDLPSQHGTAVHYRESTLMESPKLPQSFKADVIRVHVSSEHVKEHAADKLDEPEDVAATSFDHQLVAPVLPWKVSEEKVRSGLTDYGSHHVLHLTGTGVIAMDNHRRWERRMSHATHDRWRHTLFLLRS